jgi:pyruvate,water dikinase
VPDRPAGVRGVGPPGGTRRPDGAPRWRRIGIFLLERFPPLAYAPPIAAFVLCGYAGAAAAGGAGIALAPRPAVVLLTVALAFLCLRCADDLKDAGADRAEHPERPVPRGLVSAAEVGALGGAAALGGLLGALWLGGASLAAFAAWLGYFGLTAREFFAAGAIRRRPALYALLHSPLVPLLFAFVWVSHPAAPDVLGSGAAPFGRAALLAWGVGLAAEAGRKGRRRWRRARAAGPAGRAAATGAGTLRIWDNANIVESFSGVTTPLTFSVAHEAYAAVYRQACHALGVGGRTLEEHADVFEQMLGHHEGRVYYNLHSWHAVVSLLPGFRFNQGFLERMMGAARPEQGVTRPAPHARALDTARMVAVLLWRRVTFGRSARRFQARLDRLCAAQAGTDLAALSADELLDRYEWFRRRALRSWEAPIVNDFLLMVCHGALRRCAERWLGADADATVNHLLAGRHEAGAARPGLPRSLSLPSTAPGLELEVIAGRIRQEPRWRGALAAGPEAFAARLSSDGACAGLKPLLDGYLSRWGDRCPEELQLDRPSFREDPIPLYGMLASVVGVGADAAADRRARPGATGAADADAAVAAALRRLPLARRLVLAVLLRQTRRHLWWREQMRFSRGRVFGCARRLFAALGASLAASGGLDRPGDVHYLDVHELRGAIRATADAGDLRRLVRARREAFDAYRARAAPPNRFRTTGPVIVSEREPAPAPGAGAAPPETPPSAPLASGAPGRRPERVRGTGASRGRVRAPCVVIEDPRCAGAVAGRIVVARTTDPGWLPIFLAASGIAVEHGGVLSHSAIVARELGLPAVVGVRGLLTLVRAGEWLEIDGATGDVWLGAPSTPAGGTVPPARPVAVLAGRVGPAG